MAVFNPQLDIKAYAVHTFNNDILLAFGAGTPEGVYWLEQHMPGGSWEPDEDGRPLYVVGELENNTEDFKLVMVEMGEAAEPGPPYDAATATGMYDHD